MPVLLQQLLAASAGFLFLIGSMAVVTSAQLPSQHLLVAPSLPVLA